MSILMREQRKQLLSEVSYAHFKLSGPNGFKAAATVAVVRKPDDPDSFLFGVGWCSPNEHFCRKTGRYVALKDLYRDLSCDTDELPMVDIRTLSNRPWEVAKECLKGILKSKSSGLRKPSWAQYIDTVEPMSVPKKRKENK